MVLDGVGCLSCCLADSLTCFRHVMSWHGTVGVFIALFLFLGRGDGGCGDEIVGERVRRLDCGVVWCGVVWCGVVGYGMVLRI